MRIYSSHSDVDEIGRSRGPKTMSIANHHVLKRKDAFMSLTLPQPQESAAAGVLANA